MDQEKVTEVKKGSPKMIWAIVVIVILVAVGVWYFTKSDDSATTETTDTATTTTVKTPTHADWQKFTSAKYKFTLYYPTDYTLAESAVGTLKLTKGAVEMMDLYVYAANGDMPGMMRSQSALFTDDTKGYMTGGAETSLTVAGESAKKATGTFGKNAGVSQTHAGVKGSSVYFTRDDKQFIFNSYDAADATAIANFNDMMTDLSF